MLGTTRHISYGELLQDVKRMAGVLHEQGVVHGDRVLIYMPMVPEAVVAMLACARLGAIHSVVFGGKSTVVRTGRSTFILDSPEASQQTCP
jgi:propionyl-CoA synthetase